MNRSNSSKINPDGETMTDNINPALVFSRQGGRIFITDKVSASELLDPVNISTVAPLYIDDETIIINQTSLFNLPSLRTDLVKLDDDGSISWKSIK